MLRVFTEVPHQVASYGDLLLDDACWGGRERGRAKHRTSVQCLPLASHLCVACEFAEEVWYGKGHAECAEMEVSYQIAVSTTRLTMPRGCSENSWTLCCLEVFPRNM